MYDLADWGRPVAPSEMMNRERLTTQLPHSLVRVLRSRARATGVSLDVLIDSLLHEALSIPTGSEPHEDLVHSLDGATALHR